VTTTLPQTGSVPVEKRFPWGGLIVLATAVFLSVTAEMVPTGLLPEMSAGLGVTESQTGLLVSFFAFAVVFTSVPLSLLFRRIPRHTLIVGVLVVVSLTSVLASIAPNYEFLVGVRIVGGMAHGVFWSVVGAYSAHLVPKQQIGRAVALTTGGGTLAFVLGVPFSTIVGHALGWRVPFLAIGALALLGAVLIWFLLPRVEHLQHAAERNADGSRRRFGWNDSIPAVALLCILAAVVMVGHYAYYTYIAPFMIQQMNVPEAQVGLLLFFYGLAGLVGLVLSGSLFSRHPTRGLFFALAATGAAVLALAIFAANPLVAIVAFVIWGAVFGMFPTLMATQLMHFAAPAIRDASSAFYSTAFNVGIGLGALVGGFFLDLLGLTSLPWVYLATLVLGALLLVATPALTRRARRD
jgi:predicted MFS family arabinose efflux permease